MSIAATSLPDFSTLSVDARVAALLAPAGPLGDVDAWVQGEVLALVRSGIHPARLSFQGGRGKGRTLLVHTAEFTGERGPVERVILFGTSRMSPGSKRHSGAVRHEAMLRQAGPWLGSAKHPELRRVDWVSDGFRYRWDRGNAGFEPVFPAGLVEGGGSCGATAVRVARVAAAVERARVCVRGRSGSNGRDATRALWAVVDALQADRRRSRPGLFTGAGELDGEVVAGRWAALVGDELPLEPRVLAAVVDELGSAVDARGDVDVHGLVFQACLTAEGRSSAAQFFTPDEVAALMVEMLAPAPDEVFVDPACGTGSFLRAVVEFQRGRGVDTGRYASKFLFGADQDDDVVRAALGHITVLAGAATTVVRADTLASPVPAGLPPLGSVDVIAANPPFGASTAVGDARTLAGFPDIVGMPRSGDASGKAPIPAEYLYVQRLIDWLRPGGRLGLLLPNGILSNRGDLPVRRYLLDRCDVLASVTLPGHAFGPYAGTGVLTSFLVLVKKQPEAVGKPASNHPVFMCVLEDGGYDRRGKATFKRAPDGALAFTEQRERVPADGEWFDLVSYVPQSTSEYEEAAAEWRKWLARYGDRLPH